MLRVEDERWRKILNIDSLMSCKNTKTELSRRERFAEYWMDCHYERALGLIQGLSCNEVVDYAYYIAKYFGLQDLDFFNKLLN